MSGAAGSNRRRRREFKCDYKNGGFECAFVCGLPAALSIHKETTHSCTACGGYYDFLPHHHPHCTQRGRGRPPTQQPIQNLDIFPFEEIRHSLRGTLLIYSAPVQPPEECQVATVFENLYIPMQRLLEALVAHYNGIKISFRLIADMIEVTHGMQHLKDVIGSPFMSISHPNFIPTTVRSSCAYIVNSLNLYLDKGSNWQIEKLIELQICVGEWNPIRGRGYVPLPRALARRKGLLSIKTDSCCFQLSVLCALFEEEIVQEGKIKRQKIGKKEPNRNYDRDRSILEHPSSYTKFLDRLDFGFLQNQHVALVDIDLVEENFKDVSITVYGNIEKDIIVMRTPKRERARHVNLLIVKHDDSDEYHYICIRNVASFLGKKGLHKSKYCPVCQKRLDLRYWSSANHKCGETVKMPPTQQYVQFRRLDALLHAPFILYYKFFFLPVEAQGHDAASLEKVPIGFTILCVGDGNVSEHSFVGKGSVALFFETAMKLARTCVDKIKFTNNFSQPTADETKLYEEATGCEVCGEEFDESTVIKCWHHDHFDGAKMQNCCLKCNRQIKPTNYITAISLGGKNELAYLQHKIDPCHGAVTPIKRKNGSIVGLQLRQTIKKSPKFKLHFGIKFAELDNFRPDSSLSYLDEEMKLSHAEHFNVFDAKCGASGKSIDDYLRVDEAFPKFLSAQHFFSNCQTSLDELTFPHADLPTSLTSLAAEELVHLTLLAQASLIADAFEATRRQYWKEFQLDLASFWGVPSFSKEAALYMEKCKLEPVVDEEISEMIDRGIFGGIVQTTRLKSIANSELHSNFDPNRQPVQFLYADQNSCYSKPMMGNLPEGGFRIMSRQELDNFDFRRADWNNMGWIFDVDLDYQSEEVKDWISDFPFPQERRKINFSCMSIAQQSGFREKEKTFVNVERVLQTLFKKEGQVYYGKLLKWMLDHGAVITRIHSGVEFKEAPIFAKFATNNVIARNEATSELERQTRKLLNNALYGQCLKRAADYTISKTVKSSVQARRELANHTFHGFEIIDEDTAEFQLKKKMTKDLNLRIIGLAILSHAKLNLFSHYYDGLKKVFGNQCHHVMTHTDSIAAEIHCSRQEYLAGLEAISHRFDFGNLPANHPLHFKGRTGIPGLLKIQSEGVLEFYSTSGTQYSMLVDEGFKAKEIIKAGGICKKQAWKLRHETFKRVVDSGQAAEKIRVTSVRVVKDKLLTIENNHSSLCGINASRFFVSSTLSFPFGDGRIQNYQQQQAIEIVNDDNV